MKRDFGGDSDADDAGGLIRGMTADAETKKKKRKNPVSDASLVKTTNQLTEQENWIFLNGES